MSNTSNSETNTSPEPSGSSSNQGLNSLEELGKEFREHLNGLAPAARRLTVEKFRDLRVKEGHQPRSTMLWRVFSILMAVRTWRFAQLQEFGCPQKALSGFPLGANSKEYEAAIEAWIQLAERCW